MHLNSYPMKKEDMKLLIFEYVLSTIDQRIIWVSRVLSMLEFFKIKTRGGILIQVSPFSH